jgi:hypothetical protein
VNPLPKYGTVSQAAAVCSGTSATMNLTGLTPGIASTIVYNIDGGTSQTATVTADGSGNGSFPVTVVTGNQKLTITSITNKASANTRSCSVAPNISATLTVNPLPTASISGGPFCQSGNGTISVTNQTGGPFTNGNFSAAPAGLQINSSGIINLAASTAGTYTVSYTFTGANGCASGSAATAQVVVNPQATIATQPSDITFCPESGVVNVSVTSQLTNPAFNYTWQVNDGTGWQPATGADYSSTTTTTATTATNTLTISNVTNGNTKDGYLYSVQITGAAGSCAVPSNPAKLTINNIWHGTTSSDWNTATNWSGNTLPVLTCDSVIILNVTNKPILSTGAEGAVNHLVIRPGATVTVTGNTLHIAGGIWDNNGALDATAGKIDLNGNLALDGTTPRPQQTIAGKMFFTPKGTNSGRIMDLQISSPHGATVAGPTVTDTLNITGTLSFGAVSGVTLNTGDNITLISDANATARVADITNGGANSGNAINGQVIVERFFNATRKWKFLAVPTNTAQTVKEAWQEGATASLQNPAPGYGTQVTDHVAPTAANGFDYDSPDGPSVKAYNSASDLWVGIPSTFTGIKNLSGWMTFVRGDRTAIGFNAAANNTVLRTKGNLYQGNQLFSTLPYTFTSVGNPYASTIDMRRIQLSAQLGQFFTLWNPNISGAQGLGGYQTYSFDGSDFVPTPSGAGATNNDIQSGQAFFVQSSTNQAGTVTFTEQSKKSGFNTVVFRGAETALKQQLRTNLLAVNANGTTFIVDGTFQQFSDEYSNKTDNNDAMKLSNPRLNLSIKSGNDLLTIERRRLPAVSDTVFFNLTGVSVQNYRFQFIAKGLADAGVQPLLEDHFLNTLTPLSQEDTTYIDFKIENIKGSYAPDRFDIVFKESPVLPVSITSIAAYAKDHDIQVDWKVSREKNVLQYEVERSVDGLQFTKVATVKSNNAGTADYSWIDPRVLPGYYYYRVKSIDNKGKIQYTKVVTVLVGTGKPSFTVYPNPITNGIISLQFINQPAGKYGIRLMNQLGQIIVSKQIERMNGSSSESIKWDYNLAHGIYQLEILQPNGEVKIIKVIY